MLSPPAIINPRPSRRRAFRRSPRECEDLSCGAPFLRALPTLLSLPPSFTSSRMCDHPHGFTPVDRNPALLKPQHSGVAPAVALKDLVATIPDTPLVRRSIRYLKPILSVPIWNHSHRAYLHGEHGRTSRGALLIEILGQLLQSPKSTFLNGSGTPNRSTSPACFTTLGPCPRTSARPSSALSSMG